jgi:glycogen(starch) synthase
MQDLIERPEEEGCYIVDRRMQSVEDSVSQLTEFMFTFIQKTRRQRINQRNRVERLSPLLDWKNLGIEYSKARQLALRRAYPDAFYPAGEGEELNWDDALVDLTDGEDARIGVFGAGASMPASPRLRGAATPGDIGTLTEDVSLWSPSAPTLFLLGLNV